MLSFRILYSLLPERVILCLLRIERLRRALVRRGLKRALRYCWEHRSSCWYIFEGSTLCGLVETLCTIFGAVYLLRYSNVVVGRLFPEFGTCVEEFGGHRNCGYWWRAHSPRECEGRADYLRWLCGCYNIDMDAYFDKLANRG